MFSLFPLSLSILLLVVCVVKQGMKKKRAQEAYVWPMEPISSQKLAPFRPKEANVRISTKVADVG
jgi:hypothetical protein